MAPQVLEGTWEEIAERHGPELSGRRVRLTILPNEAVNSNEELLGAISEAERLQAGMRETSGEKSQELLREGRAGAMYNHERTE